MDSPIDIIYYHLIVVNKNNNREGRMPSKSVFRSESIIFGLFKLFTLIVLLFLFDGYVAMKVLFFRLDPNKKWAHAMFVSDLHSDHYTVRIGKLKTLNYLLPGTRTYVI